MIKRVQMIGHIKSAADLFLGLARELTMNTTDNAVRLHDGATVGGHEMARKDLANVDAATGAVDGKMTSTQAGDLSTTKATVTAHVGAASGHPVATPSADGFESAADKTKLDGIETAAKADQSAADIRTLGFFDITNDGAGSGLDADLLDGVEGAVYATNAEVTSEIASNVATLRGELNAPVGTKALFAQALAPTGWTKDVDQNNKALRIVSGGSGGGAAGATAFTTVFGSGKVAGGTAISAAQMPVHSHTSGSLAAGTTGATHSHALTTGSFITTSGSTEDGSGGAPNMGAQATTAVGGSHTHNVTGSVANAGSGATHNHTLSLDIQYVDIIKATKDA